MLSSLRSSPRWEGTTGAMENIDRKEGPLASKEESILAAAKRSFLAAGFGGSQHGCDRARGRRIEGDRLFPFCRQGRALRGDDRTRVRALLRAVLGRRARPPRRPRFADGIGPPLSRALAVCRVDRLAPDHSGRSYTLPGARRGVLACRTRAPTCPDRSLSQERDSIGRLGAGRYAARRRAIRLLGARRNPASPPAAARSRRRS